MIEILTSDKLEIPDFSDELIKIVQDTLTSVQPDLVCDLSIALTTDEDIRELNRQYRQVDRPTDVLSFEADEVDPVSNIRYLGDIVISYPRALQQSIDAGHPVENELKLLTVHGVLHLLGYDHDSPSKKKAMWNLQSKALERNKIKINKITGDEENE